MINNMKYFARRLIMAQYGQPNCLLRPRKNLEGLVGCSSQNPSRQGSHKQPPPPPWDNSFAFKNHGWLRLALIS